MELKPTKNLKALKVKKNVEFLQVIADETRQKICFLLENKDCCVSDLVDKFNLTQPTISHHLSILRKVGLVNANKKGQQIYYSLNKNFFLNCCCDFLSMFKCCNKISKNNNK